MKTTTKQDLRLDCIEMKRQIQTEIAKETKGMSSLERLAYYRRLAEASPFFNRSKANESAQR